jgi:aspartyl protease family protein
VDAQTLERLAYLVLLGAAILGYLLVANRDRLGTLLRQGMLWGLIFVGVIAAAGLWQDIRQASAPRQAIIAAEGRVEVPRSLDGHYYLTLEIGGVPVRFVVDTGATDIVLTRRDAERLGIDLARLAFTGSARTANGTVRTARVRLDEVALGPIRDTRVPAWVNEGEMDTSLLGMAYLNRFARIEIARDRLILTR